jgi:hypothetical protein
MNDCRFFMLLREAMREGREWVDARGHCSRAQRIGWMLLDIEREINRRELAAVRPVPVPFLPFASLRPRASA